ncbi:MULTISPECIES: PepSY domain-containing protein [Bacillaceae]|uniref:PepSY domain-containing protein n=1 Tax=Evansella alkalicola TaxID=745819 RepID=A0ABS6JQP6_9BACI|nr:MULTISPECIES: PepSY domain-containing protein [Bacillaceae]MBU9720878.1 PepSY domain-containing protein [Bacillus alkalicola]
MKKTWLAVLVGSILIAVFGFGFNQIFADPENDPLSTQEVMEIISDSYNGEVENLELEYVDGRMVYIGFMKTSQGEYEVMVDAKSGAILDVKALQTEVASDKEDVNTNSDRVDDDNGGETADLRDINDDSNDDMTSDKSTNKVSDKDDKTNTSDDNTRSATVNSSTSKDDKGSNSKYIGIARAKEIALEQIDGVIKEIELDSDDGIVYYEIEMKTAQGEAELEIHAISGEVLSFSVDSKKRSSKSNVLDLSSLIGIVEAKRIALDKVEGTVKEIELEKDDGRIYYDIEIKTSKGEVEIEIDARTGEIISIEYDD